MVLLYVSPPSLSHSLTRVHRDAIPDDRLGDFLLGMGISSVR